MMDAENNILHRECNMQNEEKSKWLALLRNKRLELQISIYRLER